MLDSAGEARIISKVMFFYGPLHVGVPVLADWQECIYICSVRTQDVVWRTGQECWMIGMNWERERVKSNLCCPWDLMMMMIYIYIYIYIWLWNKKLHWQITSFYLSHNASKGILITTMRFGLFFFSFTLKQDTLYIYIYIYIYIWLK